MIKIEFLSSTPIASVDVLETSDNAITFFQGTPVELSFITGGLKGDKGDKGAPGSITDYDPGDITLHYENALI